MNEIILTGAIVLYLVYLASKYFYPSEYIEPPEDFEPIDTDYNHYLQPKFNHITWEDKKEYLASTEWRQKRWKVLTRDGFKCVDCGTAFNLEVHHITYDRWRHEQPEDLITLCRTCHGTLHEKAHSIYNNGYSHNNKYPASILKNTPNKTHEQ